MIDIVNPQPSIATRLAALRRLLPANVEELREARPDLYPGGSNGAGARKLARDLKRLGAVPEVGVPTRGHKRAAKAIWRLP